jgi:DNA (cytosine-5)-methyltransferase 1
LTILSGLNTSPSGLSLSDTSTKIIQFGLSRGSLFNLQRCAWDKSAPTLTALGIMPISLSGPLHPAAHRKFSIPELLRLFGVPDDLDFGWSTASEAAQRLGLMVPPPMAEALFGALRDRVLRPYRGDE